MNDRCSSICRLAINNRINPAAKKLLFGARTIIMIYYGATAGITPE